MKLLKDKPDVITDNPDYPFGEIQDDNGTGNGTPVDFTLLNDYTQFFEKLFDFSLLTANGLPDNDVNGYQLWQALLMNMPKKYVFQWSSVFDGASHTITRASIDSYFADMPGVSAFYDGFNSDAGNNFASFQIDLYYLDSGVWTKIQTGTSVEPVITINNTTGDITIVLNGAPIDPAALVQAVLIG